MTNGQVTVSAHYQQEEAGRELCNGCANHVSFAHPLAERPLAQVHGGDEEGDADEEGNVRKSQIQDEHVRDGLRSKDGILFFYYLWGCQDGQ